MSAMYTSTLCLKKISPINGMRDRTGISIFFNMSTLILSVLTPYTALYRKLVKPRAKILNIMPTTDWSCLRLTPQNAMSRAPHIPASPPARMPMTILDEW